MSAQLLLFVLGVVLAVSPANAELVRLTWKHPGADAFRIYVGQLSAQGPEVSVSTFQNVQKGGDGTFSWVVDIKDPLLTSYFVVTAVDAAGAESDPSNVVTVTPKQFCTAVGCNDGIDCTVDICGLDGVCIHSPDRTRCNDGIGCTTDVCTVGVGCTHGFYVGACNDHMDCTVDDACDQGVCLGRIECPDGQHCDMQSGQCTASTTTSTVRLPIGSTTSTSTSIPLGERCGDGLVDAGEACDPGPDGWQRGEACRDDCTVVDCGDPDDSGSVTAVDSLFVIRAVVGAEHCDAAVCNVDDSSGPIGASDALRILRAALSSTIELSCPAP
jgi:hypothetical protein